MILRPALCLWLFLLLFTGYSNAQAPVFYFCGKANNDLFQVLKSEGLAVKRFDEVSNTIRAANKGALVFVIADGYPKLQPEKSLSASLLDLARKKNLHLYVEYPAAYPGLAIQQDPVVMQLERAVITSDAFGSSLKPMSILSINNAHVLVTDAKNPLMVIGKVAGFDSAPFGLKDTKTNPVLFEQQGTMIATTGLSHFARGRYGPTASWKIVWTTIISRLSGINDFSFKHWPENVHPTYTKDAELPDSARRSSVKKGVEWFYKGRFFIDESWKAEWLKYQGDGLAPFGPPVKRESKNGDGSLGILEGHASNIYFDGKQQYRYWMRADVQGEASMALASAANMFGNEDYRKKAENLINFTLHGSNLRAGRKNDSTSDAFGLIGWATTNSETFYGDDNARAILGILGASGYLHTGKWDKEMVEAILANFRTTGKSGFRGERLEEKNIIKNGWKYYWQKDSKHISPHFESWMWALYLWLYDKTKYEPLLTRTKEAIRITMEAYPNEWLWGSSMQTQRARMILPLAWLLRIENTPEHRQWLDRVTKDLLKSQVESGAIQEEIGVGVGRFKPVNSNTAYGTDEGPIIFRNGDPASCMLYTCNFAVFSLNEAAHATGDTSYVNAVKKLSNFLTRIQVSSVTNPDLDGAWFRAFDFKRWDYWGSNSDAGWGAWCTLTGWIQSWIVTTQVQIEQDQSYWALTKKSGVNDYMKSTVHQMFGQQ